MLKNLLAIVGVAGLLGACNPNDQPLRIINQTSYPNQADIVLPPGLDLEEIRFDIPRDLSQQIIKNTPACQSVLAADRDKAFWIRCGEYRAIENSNIYVTLDKDNFEKLRRNLNKLKVRDQQYQFRIEEVNRQRKEWRDLNAANLKTTPVTN